MGYELKIEQGVGYSGKHGAKAYCAEITGTSDRFGLERSFRSAAKVERDSYTKAKYTRTYIFDLQPGLYEISAGGERWYRIVSTKEGRIVSARIDAARAEAIARLMAGGVPYNDARIATKPAQVS